MDRDPSEIRQEIEATRAEMGETVDAISYKTDVQARVGDAITGKVQSIKAGAKAVAGAVTGAGTSVASAAHDQASNVAADAKDRISGITDAAGGARDAAASGLSDGANRAGSLLRDNPLGMVGGAFALGLLTGLILPISEQEKQTIGPVRDNLVDQASALGESAVEHGKQVVAETARSAMQTATTSAREHGQELIESQTLGGNGAV